MSGQSSLDDGGDRLLGGAGEVGFGCVIPPPPLPGSGSQTPVTGAHSWMHTSETLSKVEPTRARSHSSARLSSLPSKILQHRFLPALPLSGLLIYLTWILDVSGHGTTSSVPPPPGDMVGMSVVGALVGELVEGMSVGNQDGESVVGGLVGDEVGESVVGR